MKILSVIAIFFVSFSIQANSLFENSHMRSFLQAASSVEFCGANCYQASNGDNIHVDDMSCDELEQVSISLNETLSAHEEELADIKRILSRTTLRNLFVNEDELKFSGYVLNTDLIPRLKSRSLYVYNLIEKKCE